MNDKTDLNSMRVNKCGKGIEIIHGLVPQGNSIAPVQGSNIILHFHDQIFPLVVDCHGKIKIITHNHVKQES